MFTIEQKISLFSKLLHQDIKDKVNKKILQLEKDYEAHILKHKEKVDKQAENIIADALKKAEAKKIELISKGKISAKREYMLTKEKYIDIFMEHFKDKVKAFALSESYRLYLNSYMTQFETLKDHENSLTIYMTEHDFNQNKDYIATKLISLGLDQDKLNFDIANDAILGGIIIEDPKLNMRIDESLIMLIEEAKPYIIAVLFEAIGEAGEVCE